MKIIEGTYNSAKVFTDNAEETAVQQIQTLCDEPTFQDSKIRIMPDTHAGAGCVIGTTMTIKDKVVPNLVGVDIGCGMAVRIYEKQNVDFEQFDNIIRRVVPSGFDVHQDIQPLMQFVNIGGLRMYGDLNNEERVLRSMGTLGGGNHFIELNEHEDKIYLVIHSGSRNLGKQVAEHYQKIAKALHPEATKDLEYLEGEDMQKYLNDMNIAQSFAYVNREQMLQNIEKETGWKSIDMFQTIHNYIDMKNMILRKGAISAKTNERVIIPINMRDGSIIAYGNGEEDWNYSAPHGAGRVMGRREAKRKLDMTAFKETMKDVWSTSVTEETLDESPMAYKSLDNIIDNVSDSVHVKAIIKPIYNFKAS